MKKLQASYHMKFAFDYASRDIIIKTILETLIPKIKKFDSIVVSGYSMALIGSIVAHELKKNIVIVRKKDEESHSDYVAEGFSKQRCVFIDDLVATGDTLHYVHKMLKDIKGTIVGVILYFDYVQSYAEENRIEHWDNDIEKMISFPLWKNFNIEEKI